MKRMVFAAIAVFLALNGCNGQMEKKENHNQANSNMPKTDIKVNKKYDENGNLIGYDSTYSYYYSNMKNDTARVDSIFNNFRNYFSKKYSFSNEPYFRNYFFDDSLMNQDFLRHDFFSHRFMIKPENMDKLFQQMDSLKNNYLREQFRYFEDKKGKANKD